MTQTHTPKEMVWFTALDTYFMEKYSTFYVVCSWALLDMLCTVIIFSWLLFVNIFPFLVKAPHTEAEQFQMDQEKSQL